MRQGPFEVSIIKSNGAVYDEHILEGKHHIAAVTNTEYKVKVVVHKNELGFFPFPLMILGLFVDGDSVGYIRYVNANNQPYVTFQGFCKDSNLYEAFKFAVPKKIMGRNASQTSQTVGTIRVTISEAIKSEVPYTPSAGISSERNHGIQEGKKFWEQPSLQTARGGEVLGVTFQHAPFVWNRVRSTPDATLEIKYHTTDMVNFLREFHDQQEVRVVPAPASPVHVDLSAATNTPQPVRAAPETIDLTQAEKRVKVEVLPKAAKKARTGSREPTNEVVDLTM